MNLFHKRVKYTALDGQDTGFVFEVPQEGILYIESFVHPSALRSGRMRQLVLGDHCVDQVEINGAWVDYQHEPDGCIACEIEGHNRG